MNRTCKISTYILDVQLHFEITTHTYAATSSYLLPQLAYVTLNAVADCLFFHSSSSHYTTNIQTYAATTQ